jgi:CubicO group peptidase (beta-lactamase class C family)
MKFLSAILFIILISLGEEAIAQDKRTVLFDQLLSDLYNKHFFNGAIVAGQNGKILFSKGYGYANFQDSSLFTPDTPSDGGSNAKTFTAASILLLANEGKLRLSDSVQKYLSNYPYQNTTIWNFITHSVGGLPDYDYFFDHATDTVVITTSLNVDIISKNKPSLAYAPNTNFYYDNVGFDIAALIVERATGMNYNQFLKERIFGPLKMNSSFIRPARFTNWKDRTIGYQYQNDSLQLFDIADREGFYGGCNIWFTAKDLYHYGESFYHHPIFSDSVMKQITSPVFINGKLSHVSLGAWYQGKTKNAFYYWGNVAGFYSWVYWDLEKQFTIAFITNTNMPQWLRPLLTSALIDIMSNKTTLPIKKPKRNAIERTNFQQIEGKYKLDKLGKVQITVSGSKVNLRLTNGMEYRMHLVDQTSFYIPGFDPWISFSSLKGNKFQNIYWSSTVFQTEGKRISVK